MPNTNRKAQELAKKNQAHADKLSDDWKSYYFQCQAYIYLNADLTLKNEQELAKLSHRLERAEAEGIAPETKLKRDPASYGRAILRYTKANQPLVHATTVIKTIAAFIGLTLFLYAIFQAIRGWWWYGAFTPGITMPMPVSILGLTLQTAVGFLAVTLFGQFLFHSAYGRQWRTTHNILLLVGIGLALLLFIALPFLTLYYRVFVIDVPVWLILGIALIYALFKVFTDYIPVADYIQNYIDDRARKEQGKKKRQASRTQNQHPDNAHDKKNHHAKSQPDTKAEKTTDKLKHKIQGAVAKVKPAKDDSKHPKTVKTSGNQTRAEQAPASKKTKQKKEKPKKKVQKKRTEPKSKG